MAETKHARGLRLAAVDRQDRTAHGFRHIGADVETEADHTRREGTEIDADLRAAEIEQEELDQAGRTADHADIRGAEGTQNL
jgi:hypothetical protein